MNTKKPLPRMSSVRTLARLAEQGRHGSGWYVTARAEIEHASRLVGWTPERFADLLALLSPRVSVRRNIRMALHYALTGEHAHDVMRGIRSSVEHWERTGEIRGPKTSAFSAAIMGDPNAVVLDVWMARAFGIDQKAFNRIPVRAECTARIRKAARLVGMTPAECQAAVWTATVESIGYSTETRSFTVVEDAIRMRSELTPA